MPKSEGVVSHSAPHIPALPLPHFSRPGTPSALCDRSKNLHMLDGGVTQLQHRWDQLEAGKHEHSWAVGAVEQEEEVNASSGLLIHVVEQGDEEEESGRAVD
jgi:hypothetical protein